MGDKSESVPIPASKPAIPQEKPYERPTEVPLDSPKDSSSVLGDFARALTWTQQAFRLQESVIETEASVIINYPQGKGSATILKDSDGPAKVFRNGALLLQRLSKPGSDGECLWSVLSNQEVRGKFFYDKTGLMRFSLTNGDVYTFEATGEKKIEKALKPADAKVAPKKEPSCAQDLFDWMKTGLSLLDDNKDGGISFDELKKSLKKPNLSATDAAFVASMLITFDYIDKQSSRDSKITARDAAALAIPSLDPVKRLELEEINKVFLRTFARMKDKSDKLFGDFQNPIDAIKSDAVGQGAVGDCWFMGSLAALADTAPETVQKMITDNGNGTYTVTFPGKPDTPFTVDAPTNLEMALFARGSKYGVWVPVLEKAAAKAFEKEKWFNKSEISVGILNGGTAEEAFAMLTGLKPLTLDASAKNLHSVLSAATQWGLPIAAGSIIDRTDAEADANGVYGTHLYTLKYDPVKREIIVRNPWGWTSKSEPTNLDGTPKDGVADGAFRLKLEDFQKSFSSVTTVVP